MIIDGRAIATDIVSDVRAQVASLSYTPVVRAVVVHPSPPTESYLSIKQARAKEAGMHLDVVRLSANTDTTDIIAAIQAEGAHAVIVQLPLPSHHDTALVVNAIPTEKDADVLSAAAYERFEAGIPNALIPPVAGAIIEILSRANVSVANKHVVIVGQGKLVGKPAAFCMQRMGAEVAVVVRETPHKEKVLQAADIIISGAGQANLVTSDMIKEGVVLIDAGTSESNGALSGDMHPDCATKAALFTPVPGGVGPVAVACLVKNVVSLVR